MPLETADELASAVAGGLSFLIQPPFPPVSFSELDLRHLGFLYRFEPEAPPETESIHVSCAPFYRPVARELYLRVWLEDGFGITQSGALLETSQARLYDSSGALLSEGFGASDSAGANYLNITIPVVLGGSHSYRVRVWLRTDAGPTYCRDFIFSVTR